jgi:hypothetical protein
MLSWKRFYQVPLATGLAFIAFVLAADEAKTVAASKTAAPKITFSETATLSLPTQQPRALGKSWLTAQRQPRVALVIGNAAYQEEPLANPANDAADVAKALQELGFEVTLLTDKDLRAMEDAIENFSQQLHQGGVGVFYYAGHGVQVDGENYLVPLKAQLNRENDVRYEAVPLGKILNAMEDAQTQVNIVIIDACRDNPFYRRWRSRRRSSSSVRGLAPVQSARGTLIAFATAPGEFAEDGEGKNSPFTSHLLRHIKTPNLPAELMFKQVRAGVEEQTNRSQTPWEQSSLVGEFFFNPTSLSPPGTTLISKATGVDYTPLHDLLAEGKWKEADQETAKVMLQAAGRTQEGRLRLEDIDQFSCEDLRIIDRLWVDASGGKFGFSVQSQIYRELGGTRAYNVDLWVKFAEQVGWNNRERAGEAWQWLFGDELTFNLSARQGHLPWIVSWQPYQGYGQETADFGSSLALRTVTCSI